MNQHTAKPPKVRKVSQDCLDDLNGDLTKVEQTRRTPGRATPSQVANTSPWSAFKGMPVPLHAATKGCHASSS